MWVCLFDYWSPALKGTETLSMTFTGPLMDGEDLKDFTREFIKVASKQANILE